MSNDQHIFAFYLQDTFIPAVGQTFVLSDHAVVHRLVHVLRVRVGDTCIVFTRTQHAQVRIILLGARQGQAEVLSVQSTRTLLPPITLLLPLLKKEALEHVLYSAAEMGVTNIQLVYTSKSLKKGIEAGRMHRILVAAAEQAKQFVLPVLHEPRHMHDVVGRYADYHRICLATPGQRAWSVLEKCKGETTKPYALLLGPEGDFTHTEKQLLEQHGYSFMQLTPTILRASQAAVVGLGLLRSLL